MVRKNAAAKRAARALSRAEGIPYSVARRREAEETGATPPGPPGPPEYRQPRHIDDLLHDWVASWCARQLGEPVADNLLPDADLAGVLGVEIDEPTIHELTVERHSTYSTAIEQLDGGTVLSTVTATARLIVDGLLDRGAATGAAGTLVDLLNEEWNQHFSSVVARTAVELELQFSATADPDLESVENVEFDSATVLGRVDR